MSPLNYPLNELFHSGLRWEYDVYVPPTRRSNYVVTQAQYLDRLGCGLLNQEIQRVHTITQSHKRLTHTYSLKLSDTTQPVAQNLFFTNTFTFSHPPNFVLLCLKIYLSLPSYVLTSRKSVNGLPIRNQSFRLMLWCFTRIKVPYFSARSPITSATGGHLDQK